MLPEFGPGDTVVVNVKVKEGNRERVQAYEGVVIGKKNAGLNSAFTVRKISHGYGVERVFQVHSAAIDSVEVKRRGAVRAGKLYYLRGLEGKKARIKEDLAGNRSEEHTFELQSLMRISYAVFCLKKKKNFLICSSNIFQI